MRDTVPVRLQETHMFALPLSYIRSRAVEFATNEFGNSIDTEAAACHPFAHGIFDKPLHPLVFSIPLLRYRTCDDPNGSLEKGLPLVPEGISRNSIQGEWAKIGDLLFVVLENHHADIHEITFTPAEYVDVWG